MNATVIDYVPAERTLAAELDELAQVIHSGNVDRGFYEDMRHGNVHDCLAKLALVVTEIAEAIEVLREPVLSGALVSDKIPGFTAEEEEIADALIRLFDYAGWRGLRIGSAASAKLAYNETRPYRHGKRA